MTKLEGVAKAIWGASSNPASQAWDFLSENRKDAYRATVAATIRFIESAEPTAEETEAAARALWEQYQSQPYIQYATNEIMFGVFWKGKTVPWEHLLSERVVRSEAESWREKARTALLSARLVRLARIEEKQK